MRFVLVFCCVSAIAWGVSRLETSNDVYANHLLQAPWYCEEQGQVAEVQFLFEQGRSAEAVARLRNYEQRQLCAQGEMPSRGTQVLFNIPGANITIIICEQKVRAVREFAVYYPKNSSSQNPC